MQYDAAIVKHPYPIVDPSHRTRRSLQYLQAIMLRFLLGLDALADELPMAAPAVAPVAGGDREFEEAF
jgi:hypothetical protein